MENYDRSFKTNNNKSWIYISDHNYRILIIGGSGSGKTVLLNLLKKSTTRYRQSLFKHQRSIWMKISIAYLQKRKSMNYKIEKSKRIHWPFTKNWCCFWKFRRL